jgi:hypothetical protein
MLALRPKHSLRMVSSSSRRDWIEWKEVSKSLLSNLSERRESRSDLESLDYKED